MKVRLFGQKRDKKAFQKLFEEHYESVRRFAYYKTGDMDQAEDLAQETFMKCWEKFGELRPQTAKNYLFTIAANLAANQYKRKQVAVKFQMQQAIGAEAQAETPEFEMEHRQFSDLLQQALAALNEGQREVFLLNRMEELTYKEIAGRLGISVKAVEKRMSKALAELKAKLGHKL